MSVALSAELMREVEAVADEFEVSAPYVLRLSVEAGFKAAKTRLARMS